METVFLIKINGEVVAVVATHEVAKEYVNGHPLITAEEWLVRRDAR